MIDLYYLNKVDGYDYECSAQSNYTEIDVSKIYSESKNTLFINGLLTRDKQIFIADVINALNDGRDLFIEMDTPGGSVQGVREVYNSLVDFEGQVVLYSKGNIFSGGYYIASAADKIIVSQSTGIGSIGVFSMVISYKDMFDSVGIDINVIKEGKFKTLGSPYEKLTEEDSEEIQRDIKILYEDFVNVVSIGRNVDAEVIKGIGARSYYGRFAPKFLYDELEG